MARRRKHVFVKVDAKVSATQLAEHGRDFSTLIAYYPHGTVQTCVPNADEQQLVGVFARAVLDPSDVFSLASKEPGGVSEDAGADAPPPAQSQEMSG